MASEKGAQRLLAQSAAATALLMCFAIVFDLGPRTGESSTQAGGSSGPPWQSESFAEANARAPAAELAERPLDRAAVYAPADVSSAATPVAHPGPADTAAMHPEPVSDDNGIAPVLPPAIAVAAAPVAVEPAEPDVAGLWMPDSATCSLRDLQHGLLPTIITPEGASAGETFCVFKNRKPTDKGWRVTAQCVNGGRRWTTQVRLTLERNRLVWESKRGRQVYSRCDADLRIAAAP
ncbi:hypothetical protein RA307_28620 [Xanthobacteraceae bacterium Astr-EGSB]|uniref:hypothetical protein n=1 Tax=Astrobacterium formosum TaxID=3069710 RepID=UPI0027B7104C|nr:hypothetical protein [Xanthobacteraceae bacterium Astr-EGSB]